MQIRAAIAELLVSTCSIASAILLATSPATQAAGQENLVWLGAGLLSDAREQAPASPVVIGSFLKLEKNEGGKPIYTLDFQERAGPINREFADALNNSIPLMPSVRHELAAEIASLSKVCDLSKLSMKMYMAPIPGLSNDQINVKDSRRIVMLSFFDCVNPLGVNGNAIKPMPYECSYRSYDNNDSGLVLRSLVDKIQRCRISLQEYEERREATSPKP